MAIKTYVLNGSVADQQINNSVDLSFLNKISWVKTEKQPKGEVSGPLSWKIDGKAPGLEGATFYKYNNSSAKLYGIWDLSGQFDLKNLPNSADAVLKGGVSGEFIGIVAIDKSLKIVNGPVFTKDISLENIKVIDNYAQSVFGGFTSTFLGLRGESKSAGFTTISLAKSKTYKNLCDIILAETIKSYLL
mgnify:CR=1 FL=1|tara:strand:+ start:117 stop:683 length:567 start_codon:yes stop_codon:yes gene_type:complete